MKNSKREGSFPLATRCAWGWLGLILLGAIFCDFLAPYSPFEEHRRDTYHPPVKIHFWDHTGNFHFRPFVYATRSYRDAFYRRRFEPVYEKKYFLKFGIKPFVHVDGPARIYLLGADSRGRDIFSRLLYGARVSLSVGIFGAFCSALLGLFVGTVAGYFGGWWDRGLMRLSEFFMMAPSFYFLLALRSVLPMRLESIQVYWLIVGALGLIGWGGMARVIRGMVVSLREQPFIEAAWLLGRSHTQIIVGHILPPLLPYLGVVISTSIPAYVIQEAGLSVLGLGIQDPWPSWGNMLQDALSIAHLTLHPWVLAPGIALFLTAWSCYAIADRWMVQMPWRESVGS